VQLAPIIQEKEKKRLSPILSLAARKKRGEIDRSMGEKIEKIPGAATCNVELGQGSTRQVTPYSILILPMGRESITLEEMQILNCYLVAAKWSFTRKPTYAHES